MNDGVGFRVWGFGVWGLGFGVLSCFFLLTGDCLCLMEMKAHFRLYTYVHTHAHKLSLSASCGAPFSLPPSLSSLFSQNFSVHLTQKQIHTRSAEMTAIAPKSE